MIAAFVLASLLGVATLPSPRPAPPPGQWMTHKVERGDTLDGVASQWGVTAEQVVQWNPWAGRDNGRLKPGKILQVRGTARPSLRMHAIYWTNADDTWESVAEVVGTSVALLKGGPNRELADQPLRAGLSLTVLRDTSRDGWNPYASRKGSPAPKFTIEIGGLSEGHPNRGTLNNGVQLPQTDLYDLWKPEQCYGSTHAVGIVVQAIGAFREQTGWDGHLTIGSMSREGGGHFPPHKSHRSGRDVDIRLPRLDGSGSHPAHDEVDWHATWALISAFVATGQTDAIFLSRRLHPLLRRAGQDMGASAKDLAVIGTIVVHSKGHDAHLHVRIGCGIDETDCLAVAPVSGRSIKKTRPRAMSYPR